MGDSRDIMFETCRSFCTMDHGWYGAGSKMPLVWCQDELTDGYSTTSSRVQNIARSTVLLWLAHPISDSLRSFKRFEPLTGKY